MVQEGEKEIWCGEAGKLAPVTGRSHPTAPSPASHHHLSQTPQSPLPNPTITSPKPHHLSYLPPPPPASPSAAAPAPKTPAGPHTTTPARLGQGRASSPRGAGTNLGTPRLPPAPPPGGTRPAVKLQACCTHTGRSQMGFRSSEQGTGGAGAVCGFPAQGLQRAPSQALRPPMAPGLWQPHFSTAQTAPKPRPRPARGRPSLIFPGRWPRQGAPPLGGHGRG